MMAYDDVDTKCDEIHRTLMTLHYHATGMTNVTPKRR
jgi:hypothetical protein